MNSAKNLNSNSIYCGYDAAGDSAEIGLHFDIPTLLIEFEPAKPVRIMLCTLHHLSIMPSKMII
jgi:hypothetical protein